MGTKKSLICYNHDLAQVVPDSLKQVAELSGIEEKVTKFQSKLKTLEFYAIVCTSFETIREFPRGTKIFYRSLRNSLEFFIFNAIEVPRVVRSVPEQREVSL